MAKIDNSYKHAIATQVVLLKVHGTWPAMSCMKGKVASYKPGWPTAATLLGFCTMKEQGVLLLPPGWDASPSPD